MTPRDEERSLSGHIEGSLHIPSSTFSESIEQLREAAKGKSKVVFHCALSQVRPLPALAFLMYCTVKHLLARGRQDALVP